MKNATYWIAVSNKTGHINQCQALFDSMNITPEKTTLIPACTRSDHWLKKKYKKIMAIFTSIILLFLLPKGPILLVTSARESEYAAWIIKKWKGRDAFVVYLGCPVHFPDSIDMAVISRSNLPKWQSRKKDLNWSPDLEEVHICGVLARRFLESETDQNKKEPRSEEKRSIAVLIGGKNKLFSLVDEKFKYSIRSIIDLASNAENDIEIVLSRRTGSKTKKIIKDTVGSSLVGISGKSKSVRYRELLESADCFIVTPDSVTMLCEVCALGRPVYILDLEQYPGTGDTGPAFLEELLQRGVARRFDGEITDWRPDKILDEATRISSILLDRHRQAMAAEKCVISN